MKRIHDSFQRVFQRHRLVFWCGTTIVGLAAKEGE
jgi:hypothetical protein